MISSSVTIPPWLLVPELGFLDTRQIALLETLYAQILPSDHSRQIPGATEAGAAHFVSRLLAMDSETYWEIPEWRKLYPVALDALEDYSKGKYGVSLITLSDDKTLELLSAMEEGALVGLPAGINQKLLFITFRRHCIQGCFGDPRWGGNRGKIMWRAMGYLQSPEDLYDNQ